ncbi:MAG: Hpt domain-containing protein [Coriobacteriales bacterium]|nr:Hpt domain-containing protein [Coriobacteriales bacterium]
MTLQELYDRIGGDYAEAIGRLRMEKLITRFIVRFLSDTSCKDLQAAWAAGDERAAFDAAHAAKGVCANLSLVELASVASSITEALREGNESLRAQTDVDALVADLGQKYDNTIQNIEAYAATL